MKKLFILLVLLVLVGCGEGLNGNNDKNENDKITYDKNVNLDNLKNASLLGYYGTDIQAWDVVISNDETKAFVAGWGGYDSFQIIDISNSESPTLIGSLSTKYSSNYIDLSKDESKAYLSNHGFNIIDISNPTMPSIIGTYNNGHPRIGKFTINDNETIAYTVDSSVGLQILDISNPTLPVLISTYDPSENCMINGVSASRSNCEGYGISLSTDEKILYLACGWNGLKILDVSNLSLPVLIGTLDINERISNVILSSNEDIAFISGNQKFMIVDITNLKSPSLISSSIWASNGYNEIKLSNDETKAYLGGTNYGLHIVSIANIDSPILIGKFYETINNVAPQISGFDISNDNNIAYIAEGINGLRIVDIKEF